MNLFDRQDSLKPIKIIDNDEIFHNDEKMEDEKNNYAIVQEKINLEVK